MEQIIQLIGLICLSAKLKSLVLQNCDFDVDSILGKNVILNSELKIITALKANIEQIMYSCTLMAVFSICQDSDN